MGEGEPTGGQREVESSTETERLIESQLGKMVDFATDSYPQRGEDDAWETMGLGCDFSTLCEKEDRLVKDFIDAAMQKYPIIRERGEIVKSMFDKGKDTSMAASPFTMIYNMENAGNIVKNKISGHKGMSAYLEVTKQDWQQAHEIASMFPERIKEQVPEEINKVENEIIRVNGVIEKYEKGEKPTPEDCLNGKSISEPILQYLIGGTPKEGLSTAVLRMGGRFRLKIGKHHVGQKEKVNVDLGVNLGNYEVMREGSQVASDYLRFISRIMLQQGLSWLQPYQLVRQGKVNEALQNYLDREWEKRDEALSIAKRISNVLEKRINYLRSL